jgi:hypothetical protein
MTRITVSSPKYTINATGLTHSEARKMCDALAYSRFRARCECEDDVGYICPHCRHLEAAPYDWEQLVEAYSDWLFCMIARKEAQ